MSVKTGAFLLVVVTFGGAGYAGDAHEFRFGRIFTDNMVLQQKKEACLWGWAAPGEEVTVVITEDKEAARPFLDEESGNSDSACPVTVKYVEKNAPSFSPQTRSVKAGKSGAWRIRFAPLQAGFTPKYIIARTAERGIVVKNVLIGEVWLCAGQSNMKWSNFNRKGREAASADFPGLRYTAWDDSWYKPLDDIRKNIRWQECSPESAERFSAVPYLFGMFLHRYLKVPVGIINVARGGTLGQTWCMRNELDGIDSRMISTILSDYDRETAVWDDPRQVEKIMSGWKSACEEKRAEHKKRVAEAKAAGKRPPRLRLPRRPGDPRSGWSPPAGLFNATVMPIKDLGIRGVLYYQGENNNFMRWTRYEYTFPKVPVSFRRAFGDPELPFGCISQPGWGRFGVDPEVATVAEGYAIVRDIQRRALADDPHSGMIATYPTGNSYIHPGEKLPVAEYASLWALAKVYNKPVVHRGNRYERMEKKDGKIHLFFDSDPVVYDRWKHIENNAYWQVLPCPREGNAEMLGFIIAGEDRRWYPAKAERVRIHGRWSIKVYSDLVEDPVAVRYGWANWPVGNLVGRERLPLPTFRTDNWPIPKGMNYSEEVKKQTGEALKALRKEAQLQALDRKIRQLRIDMPKLEQELYLRRERSEKRFIMSKISRLEGVIKELQQEGAVERRIKKTPELQKAVEALKQAVEDVRKQVSKLRDK